MRAISSAVIAAALLVASTGQAQERAADLGYDARRQRLIVAVDWLEPY